MAEVTTNARPSLAPIPVPPHDVEEALLARRVYRTRGGAVLAILGGRVLFAPATDAAERVLPIAERATGILLVNPRETSALVSCDACILHEVSLVDGAVRRIGAAGVRAAARIDPKRVALLHEGTLRIVERRGGALVETASAPCRGESLVALEGGRVVVATGPEGEAYEVS